MQPTTLFGIASLTKSFTAVAILKLVEEGRLRLDDRVFNIIGHIKPPAGTRVDPRLNTITVRHCLNHSGGWNRDVRGDPIGWEPQICRALRLRPPLSPQHFLSYVMTIPLDFAPGSNAIYSNVGYIILGEVVHRNCEDAVRALHCRTCAPADGHHAAWHLHRLDGKYLAGEAIRYLTGSLIPLPPMLLPMVNATGGWSASVVDLGALSDQPGRQSRQAAVDREDARPHARAAGEAVTAAPERHVLRPRLGQRRPAGQVVHDVQGRQLSGDAHLHEVACRPASAGACCYNASMEFDAVDMQLASTTVQDVRRLVEDHDKFPDTDLFKEYS